MTQPDEHTSPSQIIVDGIALQGAQSMFRTDENE